MISACESLFATSPSLQEYAIILIRRSYDREQPLGDAPVVLSLIPDFYTNVNPDPHCTISKLTGSDLLSMNDQIFHRLGERFKDLLDEKGNVVGVIQQYPEIEIIERQGSMWSEKLYLLDG